MPPVFFERIRKMRICAWIELFCVVFLIFFSGLFFESLLRGAPLWPALLFAFVCAIGLYISYIYFNKFEKPEPYRIHISVKDFDSVAQALGAVMLEDDAFVVFREQERISLRILALHCKAFHKKELDVRRRRLNKCINRKYQIRSTGPWDEIGRRARINLVVCDSGNAKLTSWVCACTEMLLRRTEAIIPAALILDEETLLFPAYMQHLHIMELKRYETAALVLTECLKTQSDT